VVIPNFVDEDVFVPRKKNAGPFVFLTVCSIVRGKGVVDLLDAISRLGLKPGQAEFRIVGEGRDLDYCRKHAEQLGISDLVVWCGRRLRPDIVAMFQDADAFVLPSHYESFGMVYAEAIACGKPVVATRCGGGEYIVNETNGRLVDVGDIAGLAAALRGMIDHGDAFSSEKIRADFMARFSKRAVLSSLKAVYESAVAQRSA
jgi:glycosyltransferase involved in cell wall biosynthesis